MTTRHPLLSFTALDGSGSAGKIKFWTANGVTVNQALTGGDDIRSPLSALTGAAFTRQSITYRTIFDNPAGSDPSSLVSEAAVLIFATTSPTQFVMLNIPAIRPEYILQDGARAGMALDTDNPIVSSFISSVESGIWCNPFGYGISNLVGTILERRRT